MKWEWERQSVSRSFQSPAIDITQMPTSSLPDRSETISLIMSDHDPKVKKNTLIIAPTVAIMQWRNEFQKFSDGFKVGLLPTLNLIVSYLTGCDI